MNWLLLAAGAQFINAVVAMVDKYIVTDEKVVPKPFVYAFYSLLLTSAWIFVYLLGFIPGLKALGAPSLANVTAPTIQVVGMSFLAAYTFFMALVSMYDGLKHADTSDVMPAIGATSAVTSFGLSYALLRIDLPPHFIWGIGLLILGTLLVSRLRFTPSVAIHTIHSGLFFGLHYISMKGLFMTTSFDDGFFWSRISFMFFALSLLLVPVYFEKVASQTKKTSPMSVVLVVTNKVLAGVAAFMLLKATDLGNVSVVQSTDGLKFAFIVLLSLVIGRFFPHSVGESDFAALTIARKVLFVSIIIAGLMVLFV